MTTSLCSYSLLLQWIDEIGLNKVVISSTFEFMYKRCTIEIEHILVCI